MIIRREYRFFGQVQGVGFRWRARNAAGQLGLTGWIRNEWDGSVRMQVQGSPAAMERMIASVDSGSFIRIERTEVEQIAVVDGERSFRVTGY